MDRHAERWPDLGWGDAGLPVATRKLLERAATGAEIDPAELNAVFAAAEAPDTKPVSYFSNAVGAQYK